MLLHSMTPAELRREVETDYPPLKKYLEAHIGRIRRMLLKSPKFPAYLRMEAPRSRLGNIWQFFATALTKKQTKDPILTAWVNYETPWGRGAYRMYRHGDNPYGLIFNFTPHFFSRFNERYLISHTAEGKVNANTVEAFMCDNIHINYTIKSDGAKFEGQVKDGYIFGDYVGDNVFLVKTFVNYGKLFDDQKFTFECGVHDVLKVDNVEYGRICKINELKDSTPLNKREIEAFKYLLEFMEKRREAFSIWKK